MAPGSGATVPSNGSVSMCFFYMGRYISQHPLKPEESQNGSIIFLEQNFRKLTSKHDPREAGARRSLNFSPPKEEMNGEEVWQMHKLTLGADFRRRRRHRCLRFCILQIIGQRSQLDSMRSQFLLNVLDMANAPRQVARAKENMENIMMELHLGAWHTELQRECTQGSLVLLGEPAKDFNKLQWYLREIEWWTVQNSYSTQTSSCVMWSSLTKAVHGTAWNTSAGLRVFAAAWGVEIWATKKVK